MILPDVDDITRSRMVTCCVFHLLIIFFFMSLARIGFIWVE